MMFLLPNIAWFTLYRHVKCRYVNICSTVYKQTGMFTPNHNVTITYECTARILAENILTWRDGAMMSDVSSGLYVSVSSSFPSVIAPLHPITMIIAIF